MTCSLFSILGTMMALGKTLLVRTVSRSSFANCVSMLFILTADSLDPKSNISKTSQIDCLHSAYKEKLEMLKGTLSKVLHEIQTKKNTKEF